MKNILIIDAGLKPAWTKKTADSLAEELGKTGGYAIERINLRDEQIHPCQGCALCLSHGEEKCRNHSDSAEKILEKMIWADGIITVTPNYSLNIPWNLKNLYDRLAFVFHRPRLFHKASMAVVVQGVYGGKKILKYIDDLMSFWGCYTVKGSVVTGGVFPSTKLGEAVLNKNDRALKESVQRLVKALSKVKPKRPSLFRLAIFRMTRSSMKYSSEVLPADKAYYFDKGWEDTKYYYSVKLGPIHSLFGTMMDRMIKNMITKNLEKKQH
ncbi:MAG: flavodoxin family protein [Bacillota bacterium]|nr:flavodoxin family protein [Bacillota bacterium]